MQSAKISNFYEKVLGAIKKEEHENQRTHFLKKEKKGHIFKQENILLVILSKKKRTPSKKEIKEDNWQPCKNFH